MSDKKSQVALVLDYMIRGQYDPYMGGAQEVLEIEERSFDAPWTTKDFLAHTCQQTCIGWVAHLFDETKPKNKGKIVGYFVYDYSPGTYLDVPNFAVHPDYLRKGIGTQVLEKLIERLEHLKEVKKITGEEIQITIRNRCSRR